MEPDRRQIRLTYTASGESVLAEMLDDEAPHVCDYVWGRLPIETKVIHGMYSGLEVFAMIDRPVMNWIPWGPTAVVGGFLVLVGIMGLLRRPST